MANEKRKPIETGADIIEWAQQTRDGKGEIFTAFNKKEQLLIAEFILGMDAFIKSGGKPTDAATQAEPQVPPTDEPKPVEETQNEPTEKITNADFFRANKTGAQVAFKSFSRRLSANPDLYGIFEDGRILKAASFAYWLAMSKD